MQVLSICLSPNHHAHHCSVSACFSTITLHRIGERGPSAKRSASVLELLLKQSMSARYIIVVPPPAEIIKSSMTQCLSRQLVTEKCLLHLRDYDFLHSLLAWIRIRYEFPSPHVQHPARELFLELLLLYRKAPDRGMASGSFSLLSLQNWRDNDQHCLDFTAASVVWAVVVSHY